MTTLNELLDDFQGLRNDAATAIADRYESVADLATASSDDLTEIKGVGAKTAERLIQSAKQAPTERAPARPAATATTGSDTLLDRVAALLGGAVGIGVGLLRALQRRLT